MEIIKKVTAATYTLELDEEEAQFLRDVCNYIGGSSNNSRRRIADKLICTLERVGVTYERRTADLMDGSIYFKPTREAS